MHKVIHRRNGPHHLFPSRLRRSHRLPLTGRAAAILGSQRSLAEEETPMPGAARNGAQPTTITRLEVEPLDIPLREPFVIATGQVESARTALVRVTLADGPVGLGEAAPFPPSGGETQETALAALRAMASLVEGQDAAAWRPLAARLTAGFEHQATARAGVEV